MNNFDIWSVPGRDAHGGRKIVKYKPTEYRNELIHRFSKEELSL